MLFRFCSGRAGIYRDTGTGTGIPVTPQFRPGIPVNRNSGTPLVAVGLLFIFIINYFSPTQKLLEVSSFPSFYTALMYLSNISPWHFSGTQKHANFIPRSSLRSSIKPGDFSKCSSYSFTAVSRSYLPSR